MLDRYAIRRKPLAARTIDGEGVVITLADKQVHHFNETATVILEAIDGEHSVRQIIDALCATFDVQVERATEDVLKVMADLEAKGIVTLSDVPASAPRAP